MQSTKIYKILGMVVLWLVCVTCHAGEKVYECKVLYAYALENGSLRAINKKAQERGAIGSTFIASRDSGEILGEYVNSTNADSVRVLERGSKDWNFRVAIEWDNRRVGGTKVLQVLEVHEIDLGTIKQFKLFNAGFFGLLTGTCK